VQKYAIGLPEYIPMYVIYSSNVMQVSYYYVKQWQWATHIFTTNSKKQCMENKHVDGSTLWTLYSGGKKEFQIIT